MLGKFLKEKLYQKKSLPLNLQGFKVKTTKKKLFYEVIKAEWKYYSGSSQRETLIYLFDKTYR